MTGRVVGLVLLKGVLYSKGILCPRRKIVPFNSEARALSVANASHDVAEAKTSTALDKRVKLGKLFLPDLLS